MKISSEDHLGLRGAALARAIVKREAEEGGGDGRGGEGQLEVVGEVGRCRFGEVGLKLSLNLREVGLSRLGTIGMGVVGATMVGELVMSGEIDGWLVGRWRPRKARAARAWVSCNSAKQKLSWKLLFIDDISGQYSAFG